MTGNMPPTLSRHAQDQHACGTQHPPLPSTISTAFGLGNNNVMNVVLGIGFFQCTRSLHEYRTGELARGLEQAP